MAANIMAVADRNKLPLAAAIVSGEYHGPQLVEEIIRARAVRRQPQRLIGDNFYDSDDTNKTHFVPIKIAQPHRSRERSKNQNRLPSRRYCNLKKVDRLLA